MLNVGELFAELAHFVLSGRTLPENGCTETWLRNTLRENSPGELDARRLGYVILSGRSLPENWFRSIQAFKNGCGVLTGTTLREKSPGEWVSLCSVM